MPLPLRRSPAPIAALLAVLVVTIPVGAAAPGRSERVARGYTKLLVAADRAQETAAIVHRIERGPGRSVQVLRGPGLLAVRVRRSDASALRRRLERIPGVRFVERNRAASRLAATSYAQTVPTDPLWPEQWGPALIGAPAIWKLTKGSPSVVIAVLDTGVDSSQPDLRRALIPGFDAVNGDHDPSDDNGHGTRTAGIAGARADNGVGISGMCPGCSIMPVKVAAANGWSTDLQLVSGITWATDHGADVISISLAGSTPSGTVAAAVNYAESKGVLVVAGAGNTGDSQPSYPADYPGVLSVAGTDPEDKLYPWSTRGSWVQVAAPGCDVTTFTDGFGRFCGTSASTPVVAGLAGLALSYAPTASAAMVQQAIVSGARPIDGVAGGRVDAVGTLAALGAKFEPAPAQQAAAKATKDKRPVRHARHSAGPARVRRGLLRTEWRVGVAVRRGPVVAVLRSPKAGSCSIRFHSARQLRPWRRHGRNSDALAARVAAGTYSLDVRCSRGVPQPASLTVRAHFARAHHGSHGRRSRHASRGRSVAVVIRRDPF